MKEQISFLPNNEQRNKKVFQLKTLLFGLVGLLAVETNISAQSVEKKNTINEINKLRSEAKEIILELKSGQDSIVLPEKTIVYNITSFPKNAVPYSLYKNVTLDENSKAVAVTEKHKDGTVLTFGDGLLWERTKKTEALPATGFPKIYFNNGEGEFFSNGNGEQVKKVAEGQELTGEDFNDYSFSSNHFNDGSIGYMNINLKKAEAEAFTKKSQEKYIDDLKLIQNAQKLIK